MPVSKWLLLRQSMTRTMNLCLRLKLWGNLWLCSFWRGYGIQYAPDPEDPLQPRWTPVRTWDGPRDLGLRPVFSCGMSTHIWWGNETYRALISETSRRGMHSQMRNSRFPDQTIINRNHTIIQMWRTERSDASWQQFQQGAFFSTLAI